MMRKAVTVVAACVLVTGIASAQMKKKPAPAAPASSGPLAVAGANKQQASVDNVRRITIGEAQKLMNKGDAVMIDVRSNEQYSLGHIRGAYSIPGSQLISRLKELPPGKMIITYCACTAEQSSGRAVIDLNNHGVKNAAALKGGWTEWKAAGLPIAAGPK